MPEIASPNSNTTGDGTRVSALTLIAFSCPLSMFDVFEQVCVDLILERRAHSVRRALIDLQRGILDDFGRKHRRGAYRHDLVVISVVRCPRG
jgi:hypothetical protein